MADCDYSNAGQGSFRYVCGNGLNALVERGIVNNELPPGWCGPNNGNNMYRFTNCPCNPQSRQPAVLPCYAKGCYWQATDRPAAVFTCNKILR